MKKAMLMIIMITIIIRQRDRQRETNLTNAQQLIASQLSTYIDISLAKWCCGERMIFGKSAEHTENRQHM